MFYREVYDVWLTVRGVGEMSKTIKRKEFIIAGLAVGVIVAGLALLLISLNGASFAVLSSNSEENLVAQVEAGEENEDSLYIENENSRYIMSSDGRVLARLHIEKYHFEQFARYNPANCMQGFEELQTANPDVIGWINVFDTGIDYPLVHATDNNFYMNHSVWRDFSLLGSIILCSENDRQFRNAINAIHGHPLYPNGMFEDVSSFQDFEFFDNRRYGNLFFYRDGVGYANHGLELFAFVEASGYDEDIFDLPPPSDSDYYYGRGIGFNPINQEYESQQAYFEMISAKAMHIRNIDIAEDDTIVMLITQTNNLANGRHILVARLKDEPFPNEFLD